MGKEVKPEGVTLYDPTDHKTNRSMFFNTARDTLGKVFPQSYGGVRIELDKVHYAEGDDTTYDFKRQKDAVLKNEYLHKRLRGNVKLFDDKTNELLDEKELTLMRVPYMTDRGTFVHGGNEYSMLNQSRLKSGAYTRIKANSELETQFNVEQNTGKNFRVRFEPESARYKLDIGQSSLDMYSLLHDMGVSDDDLKKSWGEDILEANKAKYDTRVLDKAYQRFIRNKEPDASREAKAEAVKEFFNKANINKRVAQINLPNMFDRDLGVKWAKQASEMAKEATITLPEKDPVEKLILTDSFPTTAYRKMAFWLNLEYNMQLNLLDSREKLASDILDIIEEDDVIEKDLLEYIFDRDLLDVEVKEAAKHKSNVGSIVMLPNGDGTYMMQKEDDGKMRPPGGHMGALDSNHFNCLIRELEEEFGLPKDKTAPHITFLGYEYRDKYAGTAVFVFNNHNLKPRVYQASNSLNETVTLVKCRLTDPDYIGPDPDLLKATLEKSDPYEKGCLMLTFDMEDNVMIQKWNRNKIPARRLIGEGRETLPHLTVGYGFDINFDWRDLKEGLQWEDDFYVELGKVTRFPADKDRPDSDVLVIKCKSPKLDILRKQVTDKYKDVYNDRWNPHITLAYVKPNALPSLDGNRFFEGKLIKVSGAIYAGKKVYKVKEIK